MLLYLECALLVLSGFFAAMIGILLGAGNAIPFAGLQVSGGGAVFLGILYGGLGIAAFYLATELRRLVGWTRTGVIVLQAVLIVLFLARGELSASTGVSVVLCLLTAGLLLTPSAGAALTSDQRSRPQGSGAGGATPSAAPSGTAPR